MKKKKRVFLNFKSVKVGDNILARSIDKTVKGIITKLHPGAAVIKSNQGLVVIDSNQIIKKF